MPACTFRTGSKGCVTPAFTVQTPLRTFRLQNFPRNGRQVSGHEFTRAVSALKNPGFSPCSSTPKLRNISTPHVHSLATVILSDGAGHRALRGGLSRSRRTPARFRTAARFQIPHDNLKTLPKTPTYQRQQVSGHDFAKTQPAQRAKEPSPERKRWVSGKDDLSAVGATQFLRSSDSKNNVRNISTPHVHSLPTVILSDGAGVERPSRSRRTPARLRTASRYQIPHDNLKTLTGQLITLYQRQQVTGLRFSASISHPLEPGFSPCSSRPKLRNISTPHVRPLPTVIPSDGAGVERLSRTRRTQARLQGAFKIPH
jgi:hypothetical protein